MTLSVKPFGLICGYLLLCFLLNGCSKVTYEEHCAPKLTYRFPEAIPFVLLDMEREAITTFVENVGLIPRVGFTTKLSAVPEETRVHLSMREIESKNVHLLGPVLRYQKSMYAITNYSSLLFYVDIEGHYAWLSPTTLSIFATQNPGNTNLQNQTQLTALKLERFDYEALPECMKK